jgi:MFS family permease
MRTRFWRVVVLVTTWHVAASICYYAVYAGAPLFQDAFSLSGFQIGLLITALSLGYALALLPFGVVTDRFGERRTLTGGLAGLSLAVLAVALAPTYGLLLGAAVLLGSMYGSATPGTNKAIFDRIDPGRQHRALGIKQVGPTVGSAVGAVLVTGLAGAAAWQSGFLAAAAVGLAVTLVFFVGYRGSDRAEATVPDFRALLSNRTYLVLLAVGFCIGAAFYTATGYTVLFVDESVGATVGVAGLVLATLQIASSAGRVAAGTLADVLPGTARRRTGTILLVQVGVGAVLFLSLPLADSLLVAGAVFVGLGLSILGSVSLYYSCISTTVDEEELGAASAAGQLSVTASGLVAPPAFGYLVDASGYAAGWGLLSAFAFVAAALVLVVVLDPR